MPMVVLLFFPAAPISAQPRVYARDNTSSRYISARQFSGNKAEACRPPARSRPSGWRAARSGAVVLVPDSVIPWFCAQDHGGGSLPPSSVEQAKRVEGGAQRSCTAEKSWNAVTSAAWHRFGLGGKRYHARRRPVSMIKIAGWHKHSIRGLDLVSQFRYHPKLHHSQTSRMAWRRAGR